MKQDLAALLGQFREKSGLTQEQLAEKLNVSRQAVSKWECGDATPDLDNLVALAELYGITLDELTGRVVPQSKPNVHISFKDGVNVQSKDKQVHVGWDGVHVNDEGVWIDGTHYDDFKEVHDAWKRTRKRSAFARIPVIPLLFVAFLILCFFYQDWRLGLGILACAFIWSSLTEVVDAIYFKRGSKKICDHVGGLFFSAGLSGFLFVGFVWGQWAAGPVLSFPGWYLVVGGAILCFLTHILWPKPEAQKE